MNRRAQQELRFKVAKPEELFAFLQAQLPHKSRKELKSLLAHQQVRVADQVVSQFNHPLRQGQTVTVNTGKVAREKKIPGLEILYEDTVLLVINKQAGLLSIATAKEKERTAYSLLNEYVAKKDPRHRVFIVHRLDRETSGIMMFAKSKEVQQSLQHNWQETVRERGYLAVVEGVPDKTAGTVTSWLKENKNLLVYSSPVRGEGQKAVTHYRVLKSNNYYALIETKLETGRKNQIRVHMQDLGHSVVGDKKYGAIKNPLKRLGLHAHRLVFTHPVTGKLMRFETEVPAVFARLFQQEQRQE
jgi:23S rRNA pseudouridine1911/1915/1917 synthase